MSNRTARKRRPTNEGGTVTDLVQPVAARREQAFLECHADGHQWRHEGFVGAPDWTPPLQMQGAIARHSICTNCGAERARWYTRSGEVLNRYKHQDGYLHKRTTPDDYAPSRLEYRQRMVVGLFDQFAAIIDRQTSGPKRGRPRKRAAS